MSENSDASFNLLDEPFIFAVDETGLSSEQSILSLFRNASSLRTVSGSSALQELAFVRILLAILYRALPQEVADEQGWLELWRSGIPVGRVEAYLAQHHPRFELLHPTTPFYQVSGVQYESEKHESERHIAELFVDSARYMSVPINTGGPRSLPFAEAARRLIEVQNYRTASRKSRLTGDPRVKKAYYAQPGWLGNGSFVLLTGKTLEQTLLLNLVPYNLMPEVDQVADLPVWEQPSATVEPRRMLGELEAYGSATGPCDLYTFQIARVALVHDGSQVTDAKLGIGDRLFKYDQHLYEPMLSWRHIDRQDGSKAWAPMRINRDIWRGLSSLMAQVQDAKIEMMRAKTLDFFQQVEEDIEVELGHHLGIKTYEAEYGAQEAIITNTTVSQLNLPSTLLDPRNYPELEVAYRAASIAKEVAEAVRAFATNLTVASGKERNPVKGTKAYQIAQPEEDRTLHTLRRAYEAWLNQSHKDRHQWLNDWLEIARREGLQRLNDLAAAAPLSTLAGVQESPGDSSSLMNYGLASSRARKKIYKLTEQAEKE